MTSHPTPTQEGAYWAKWRICDEGTADEDEFTPNTEWEVVTVFVNGRDESDSEHLRVFVPGVEKDQHIENFVWGAGPLRPPASIATDNNV